MSKAKISQKEILTAQLLLEETFLRLSKGAGDPADFSVTVTLHRRFGDISMRLESLGEQYNPLVEMTEVNEGKEDAYGLAILKAHREEVGYSRKNGKNLVSIRIHKSASKDFLLGNFGPGQFLFQPSHGFCKGAIAQYHNN